jgi:Porin subfamily
LSAAFHRISTIGATVVNFTPTNAAIPGVVVNPQVPTVSGGYGAKSGNGWAVQGGVKINLPMLAAGDTLYLQAAYSKGEIGYVDSGFPGSFSAGGFVATFDSMPAYDAVITPSGKLRLTPAWSAMASLEHYWTPTIRQGLFGGAAHYGYGSTMRSAAGFAAGVNCPTCLGTVLVATGPGAAVTPYNPFSTQYNGGTQYNIGSNLIWSPVKDLDIGVEVYYARDQFQHKEWDTNRGNGFTIKSADVWLSRLRVSRDF